MNDIFEKLLKKLDKFENHLSNFDQKIEILENDIENLKEGETNE